MRRLLPLVLLAGCVRMTEYHAMDEHGGYANWSQKPGVHHIEVMVNSRTPMTFAGMYFNRRALDLCRAEGFSRYEGAPESYVGTGYSPAQSSARTFTDMGGSKQYEDHSQGGFTYYAGGKAIGDVVCTGDRIAAVPLPPDPPTQEQQDDAYHAQRHTNYTNPDQGGRPVY